MASVITIAFENWKAQEAASGKAVLLDEFVFANVPNLDPTKPIDRNEKLPPASQIVHRQAVNKAGLASENAVAYSVTMGADVGNFDFNWIGLLNKASGTVAMITHAPTQKKLKNQNGQQGNVLTRSFILEFQGAAEETQIRTSAETWQIDFTARLSGIDEMQRLINVDSYGAAAFFNESFEVTRSGEQFTVKKGLGYVGGLRGELAQNQILNGLRNTKVYADFSYQGNIVSQWNTVVKITAAATLNNYVDAAGFTHQVFAIASIDTNGNVKDLRPMGALSSQEISALETRFKLDLSKKIDKANITSQTGNSTELVVNQHLLTVELGKKQPAGNYAPAGDYATNAALNSGLGLKIDKTSVVQSTGTSTTQVISQDAATKNFIKRYEYGLGNVVSFAGVTANSEENPFGGTGAVKLTGTPVSNGYNGLLYMTQGGEFKLAGVTISGSGARGEVSNFYSDKNTYKDRNGYVKTSKTDEDIQSVPIGASIIWNTSASIPENFWPNEGRSFSAAEYPELAKIFPALKLPDDRGYGIRIADNGRGIDAGRTVGTYQEDAMQRIQGKVEGGTYALFWSGNPTASGAFKRTSSDGPHANSGTINGNQSRGLEFDSGSVVRTADETRMKNVAKILITRVK
ncbi:phage tail protein [Providencia rettgeri]|uniref:Phage tail protein n=1 Tax=Providencia rettgeri TaxID=587 RepID=A0AAJ4NHA6_PRORE|nr:phage tail protein [Providencia rettgeri]QWQ16196.1 phage tail protein [Providencia rettgeri]QWQ20030.1 phage tail protein [Providencia rettgeri]QWQ23867.1 phage tail protein [Providencia rettgeri]